MPVIAAAGVGQGDRSGYPLYGNLDTQPPGVKPQPGTVLVAPRLLALLNLKVGDNLDVGDTTLRIAAVINQEPDSGFNPFQTAPRVIMNLQDVPKTGAIQPGSRLTYRYMFAGSAQNIATYGEAVKGLLAGTSAGMAWKSLTGR